MSDRGAILTSPGPRRLRPKGARSSSWRSWPMLLLVAVALVGGAVGEADAADDAGAPGAFLRFGSSARGLALGNSMTGLADDLEASFWNPAGLANLRTMELTAMGATLFEDTQYTFFALGLPTQSMGTFGISGAFQRSGGFERATLFQDLDETFSQTDSYFALSYARAYGRFTWGVTLKSVAQSVGGASGGGVGADLGLYARPTRRLSIGFSIQNVVAPEITLDQVSEPLARTYRGGAALRFFGGRFTALADLAKTENVDLDFATGLEVWPDRAFGLRAGYDTARDQATWGAGFRWENWQFDYSFVPGDLGVTNVLSATLRFGVPYGVKIHRDRTLFSPSGHDRNVSFDIETAVRGRVEEWRLEITDAEGKTVRTLAGHGSPPEGVTWGGEDDDGRMVSDGRYHARVTILDDLGEEWDYRTSVEVLGFRDRTRPPIRMDISGSTETDPGGEDR